MTKHTINFNEVITKQINTFIKNNKCVGIIKSYNLIREYEFPAPININQNAEKAERSANFYKILSEHKALLIEKQNIYIINPNTPFYKTLEFLIW